MNKTRQWGLLTAVACLAILAAGWMLVVKPQRGHAADLRTQAATVRSNISTLESQVNQLKQQQKDLPAQQKLLSQIATKIPDNPALPSLIRQLSAAADGAGVNLVSLAPSVPAAPAPGAAAAAAQSIPIVINVQGSYFNIEQFFSAVESLNRAMLVSGFSLATAQVAGAGGGAAPLNASINATVFDSPQVAAAPPAAAATTAPTGR